MNNALVSVPDLDGIIASGEHCLTELDARAPAPPDHLPAILAALAANPEGRLQLVRTKMQPVDLLRILVAQGVSAGTRPLADGTWRTTLRRPASGAARSH
jgi:hypothetical protein